MEPGSGDDGRDQDDDDGALALPTVVMDPRSPASPGDLRTRPTPRVPRAYVSRPSIEPPTESSRPRLADDPAPEEGADLASALEPHLAWLDESRRSELYLTLLKGQFALALSTLERESARFPRNLSIVRAKQMVERVAIHHLIGKLRPLDRVPVLVERARVRRVTTAVSELLKLCDGVASLEEILRKSKAPRLSTLQILSGLVERGALVLSRPRHRAFLDEALAAPEEAPVAEPLHAGDDAEPVTGRATLPDPVEARYLAALMPPPSGPQRRPTLRGMPAVTAPPPRTPELDEPDVQSVPVAASAPPEVAAPTADGPPSSPRPELYSIPALELPEGGPAAPPAALVPEPLPPAAPTSPVAPPSAAPMVAPGPPPSSLPAAELVRSGPSRRAVVIGGLGLLGAVAIALIVWSPSDPEPEPIAPPPSPARGPEGAVSAPALAPERAVEGPGAPSTIRLTVEVTPRGAKVKLDGEVLRDPFHKTLPRADVEHVVEVEARGYQKRKARFRATADANIIIALDRLPPKESPPEQSSDPEPLPPPPETEVDPYEDG